MSTQKEPDFYFDLYEGEQVLLFLRQHPATNVRWVLFTTFMLFSPWLVSLLLWDSVLPPLVLVFSKVLLWFWYLLTIGFALEQFLLWYFNVYLVTDKRIIDVKVYNFLRRKIAETPLSNVQDVTFETTGLMGTVINMGNVYIQTAGATREFHFERIDNPEHVHDIIIDQLKHRGKHVHL